jgi:hypothetical protein
MAGNLPFNEIPDNDGNKKPADQNPSGEGGSDSPKEITAPDGNNDVKPNSIWILFGALDAGVILLFWGYSEFFGSHNSPILSNLCFFGFSASVLAALAAFTFKHCPHIKIICFIYFLLCGSFGLLIYDFSKSLPMESPAVENNAADWQPPELPTDCTNIIIDFGGQEMSIPIPYAEISPTTNGTKFALKDLAPEFLTGFDKMTNYSPRLRNMWMRFGSGQTTIGGKVVEYPIWPFVISNRLFMYVEIPFQNEKQFIEMDDGFDNKLKIPRLWDRNYNSNSYEIVTETTNPVLQVIYKKANKVQVNGFYLIDPTNIYVAFNNYMPTLIVPHAIDIKTKQEIHFANAFVVWDATNAYDLPLGQKPIFKYPSWKYPGALDKPEASDSKLPLGVGYGIIGAGILWMSFGWIFFQKRSNIKQP